MEAAELRIGNYIDGHYDYDKGEPLWMQCKVLALDSVGLTEHEIWVEGEGFNETYYDFRGIPLTEKWLIKFGFEKDDSGVEMNDPDYCDWYQKEFPIIGELCQSSDKSYLFDTETDTLRIKYVHQLQNLYFALCGEELKELEGEG